MSTGMPHVRVSKFLKCGHTPTLQVCSRQRDVQTCCYDYKHTHILSHVLVGDTHSQLTRPYHPPLFDWLRACASGGKPYVTYSISPLPEKFSLHAKKPRGKRRYLHCIKENHCASLPGSRYTHTSFVQSKFCCTSFAKSNGISTASSPTSPLSCNRGEKHSPFKPHCRAKADDAPEFRSTPFAHHVPPAALQPQNK